MRISSADTTPYTYQLRLSIGDISDYGHYPNYSSVATENFFKLGSGSLDMDRTDTPHHGYQSVITKEEPLYLYGGSKIEAECSNDSTFDMIIAYRDCFF